MKVAHYPFVAPFATTFDPAATSPSHNPLNSPMPRKNDAEVKIRIPKALRDTVERLALERMTSSGSIFRQAAIDYIKGQGIELKETVGAPSIPAKPTGKPVIYRLKKGTQRKILDTVKKHVGKSPSPSPPK